MKNCLLIGLLYLFTSSCVTQKKGGCPVVYNATISECKDSMCITEDIGVILIYPDKIYAGENSYSIIQQTKANTFYCVDDKTLRRCTITKYDKNGYKIVSIYSRDINKYYILYPKEDYLFTKQ